MRGDHRGPPGDMRGDHRGPPGDMRGDHRGPPGDMRGDHRGPPGDMRGDHRGQKEGFRDPSFVEGDSNSGKCGKPVCPGLDADGNDMMDCEAPGVDRQKCQKQNLNNSRSGVQHDQSIEYKKAKQNCEAPGVDRQKCQEQNQDRN
jgi:hypothetical protein